MQKRFKFYFFILSVLNLCEKIQICLSGKERVKNEKKNGNEVNEKLDKKIVNRARNEIGLVSRKPQTN